MLEVLRSRYPSADWELKQNKCELWVGEGYLTYLVRFVNNSSTCCYFEVLDDELELIFKFGNVDDNEFNRLLFCFDGWVRNLISGFSVFLNVADNAEVSHAIADKELIRLIELCFSPPVFNWKKLGSEKKCIYRAKLNSEFDTEITYDYNEEWTVAVWGYEDEPTIFFAEDEPEKAFDHLLTWLKDRAIID